MSVLYPDRPLAAVWFRGDVAPAGACLILSRRMVAPFAARMLVCSSTSGGLVLDGFLVGNRHQLPDAQQLPVDHFVPGGPRQFGLRLPAAAGDLTRRTLDGMIDYITGLDGDQPACSLGQYRGLDPLRFVGETASALRVPELHVDAALPMVDVVLRFTNPTPDPLPVRAVLIGLLLDTEGRDGN